MSDRTLCVFLRAPERGKVKTRLAASVGDDITLRLYAAFVEDSVAAAADACRRADAELVLAVAGPIDHPAIVALATQHGARVLAQVAGDLGARMGAVLDAAPGRAVVVVGSDAPHLTGAQIARAFPALVTHEVVLGPGRDGGYWLLGATRPVPELLDDMPWSQPGLLARTLERLAGTSAQLLEMAFDIDDEGDLELLKLWLGVAPAHVAPATRRALAATSP